MFVFPPKEKDGKNWGKERMSSVKYILFSHLAETWLREIGETQV